MTYTNSWSNVIPAGTLPANQIDTAMQRFRLDIYERLNTILGAATDMTDDPVVDGTNNMDLTALVTALNTKTTITGLTIGKLLVATGPGAVGNSAYSDATIAALIAATSYTTTVANTSTTNVTKFSLSLAAGTWLITFVGDCGSPANYAEMTGQTNGTIRESYGGSGGVNYFTMTALVVSDGATPIALKTDASTTQFYATYKRM